MERRRTKTKNAKLDREGRKARKIEKIWKKGEKRGDPLGKEAKIGLGAS